MIARHGKLIHFKTYGKRDLASGAAVEKDTIFRIYSMTKPVTGVAMMMLYEDGKWKHEDPISRYIPEFANLKVYKGVDDKGEMIVEDPVHRPTVGELMSHTAGFTYGIFGNTPVDKMYLQKGIFASKTLKEAVGKLGTIPLLYQPGSKWVYSYSVDIQGYLVEKLSGMPFDVFLQKRIFEPLNMKDTGFYVPKEKASRFATVYDVDPSGKLVAPTSPAANMDFFNAPTAPSGGGGLVSTAEDYMRFAQMLLNGGQINGVRLLAPSSVQLMSSNKLSNQLLNGGFGIGQQRIRPGFGFGYDVAVFHDPSMAGSTAGKGTYLWEGAAGTWFWIDPTNDIVFVGMVQRMLNATSPDMHHLSRALTFQALVEPQK